MSEVRVNNIVDYGGKGAPTFDNGAVISGVSSLGNQAKIGSNVTITSGGINVSGVTTAATLSGNLTGDVSAGFLTATSTVIGSGVTINAGGLNITGVCTATTFEGSGTSLTGVAMTIAPLAYNPDVGDSSVGLQPGIGVTFDHRILAGSGNITLSIATNAGAAGTTVENFGVGSSVTIAGRKLVFTPTSELTALETYHVGIPAGAVTNTSGDVSLEATNWTFQARDYNYQYWAWGYNTYGALAQNNQTNYSSPVQVPSTSWRTILRNYPNEGQTVLATKSDGTLWAWSINDYGQLGLNNRTTYSSPVQVGSDTTWNTGVIGHGNRAQVLATKTDGTLWSWGGENFGQLGQNSVVHKSSPVQIPGTTWSKGRFKRAGLAFGSLAVKTDGTLWSWGYNSYGMLGLNNRTHYSSPVQIPGTTWSSVGGGNHAHAIKTDGTLWSWGINGHGMLGLNNTTSYSSPVQIPGTNWANIAGGTNCTVATKTDGTLWAWGVNGKGNLGINQQGNNISSPIQIPGTNWDTENFFVGEQYGGAIKTDGTLWSWGYNYAGPLGQNASSTNVLYSSPVQIPGTTWSYTTSVNSYGSAALKQL